MISLDTNIMVRIFVDDPQCPEQNNKARQIVGEYESLLKKDHPHYDDLLRLRAQLLSKPIRSGFRQPAKNPGKNKPKKRR